MLFRSVSQSRYLRGNTSFRNFLTNSQTFRRTIFNAQLSASITRKLHIFQLISIKKSARRSLGWIPFKKVAIKYADGYVQYGKHQFKLWDSYGLSKYAVRTGSFVEDSRGRWYVCLVVDSSNQEKPTATKAIGIDLGLKNIATCSDGTVISNPQNLRVFLLKILQNYLPKKYCRSCAKN